MEGALGGGGGLGRGGGQVQGTNWDNSRGRAGLLLHLDFHCKSSSTAADQFLFHDKFMANL